MHTKRMRCPKVEPANSGVSGVVLYRASHGSDIFDAQVESTPGGRVEQCRVGEMMPSVSVLHVPYTFFPDEAGGTEVYVSELGAAMRELGLRVAIAAPGTQEAKYLHGDLEIYRFKKASQPAFGQAYGEPDTIAAESFRALLQKLRPDIVHLHAHTAAVSHLLVDAAHEAGARVLLTYHSPTVSCLRGTMMLFGAQSCDGVMDAKRCTVCTLHNHGVPRPAGRLLTSLPSALGRMVTRSGLSGGVFTALRMAQATKGFHDGVRELLRKVDGVIAVSDWVLDVLARNGVPQSKLLLCRQGAQIARAAQAPSVQLPDQSSAKLRLAFFGRLDPMKGLDTILRAFELMRDTQVVLDIYGLTQPHSERYVASLHAHGDSRVQFREALSSGDVRQAMEGYDFVVVPSRWLETGPLVVYEAFQAGTPVLGSRLGGIAELVTDGVDGVLLGADSAESWAKTIAALAEDPERVRKLRRGVRPPRTMRDAAEEMVRHYHALFTGARPAVRNAAPNADEPAESERLGQPV